MNSELVRVYSSREEHGIIPTDLFGHRSVEVISGVGINRQGTLPAEGIFNLTKEQHRDYNLISQRVLLNRPVAVRSGDKVFFTSGGANNPWWE